MLNNFCRFPFLKRLLTKLYLLGTRGLFRQATLKVRQEMMVEENTLILGKL